MAVLRTFQHGAMCYLALTLAAPSLFPDRIAYSQVTTGAITGISPNSDTAEARRRLAIAHRRRTEQAIENAKYDQLLTPSSATPASDTAKRSRHRPTRMHRGITPLGRKKATQVTPPEEGP
jgi:hypothetical protein